MARRGKVKGGAAVGDSSNGCGDSVYVTRNVKLRFTPEDHAFWTNILKESTECFNDISDLIAKTSCPLTIKAVHNLVYFPMRKAHPLLPAQAVIKIEHDVLANARTSKNRTLPKRTHCSIRLDGRTCSHLTAESVKLASAKPYKRCMAELVAYEDFRRFSSKYEMGDPLIFLRGSDIYLCVPFKVEALPVTNERVVGVDLGWRRIFVTSDGMAKKGNDYKKRRRCTRHQKRQLQRKGTKSAKRKLRQLRHREFNQSRSFVHQTANELLAMDAGILVLEDLKGLKKHTSRGEDGFLRKKHNSKLSQIPFYRIRYTATHKAPLRGKRVETVSPNFTSQINCATGERNGLRKGCRYYTADGKVFDADWNAAVNIRNTKHPSSFTLPLDGRLNFVGQGSVDSPYGRMGCTKWPSCKTRSLRRSTPSRS